MDQILKKRFINSLLAFFLLVLSCEAFCAKTNAETSDQSKNKGYLFVQAAQRATIKLDANTNNYKLELKSVMPYVTYFSERPKRYSSTMPLDQFLALWQDRAGNGFKNNPPNVDLHGMSVKIFTPDQPFNLTVELSNPTYDPRFQTLSYQAKPLSNKIPLPESVILSDVILFIDQVCLSCWGN